MSPLVFACIAPHGGEIIPELSGELPERMGVTRDNMKKMGQKMEEAKPDCIILLTPHGTRINGQFSIADSERLTGVLEENGSVYRMERPTDRTLARLIVEQSRKQDIPAASINYATSEGPYSCLPLDWGAMVPLRFMPEVPVVIITPSREVSFELHIRFGTAIREAVQKSGKRVGLIASCDWSHAHDENGPYGFDPAAQQLDEEAVQLIKANELEKMMDWDLSFIDAAKPDGIWQTLILAGAIPAEDRIVDLHSYECPTYFGLICASYQ
ncbi:extradiol ring-cleavage dioxygenase [Peribacillus sp. SCS-155]|uniref:DODA-type extradiol aromatic ring-opening family dioxygenase n=1 Tax=Peribacillus sedimenti TaxID=3115297 RepID=UPI003905BD4B